MANKTLNARIVQKHDTQVNWEKATGFIPKAGEVIVYDADENYSYPRIKIGNGEATVSELPFAASQPNWDAAEGEAGYIGNKPNVVKSVNGTLLPDENGDIQMITIDTLQFMDMSGFGGGIQCNKTAEEAFATISGQGVLAVYRRIWLGNSDGNPKDVYTLDVVSRTFDPNILKIDFKDGRAPIIVNATDNTITLDPDWVAPEPIIPETSNPHQQLVTDGDGNKVWEEKLAYEQIVPNADIATKQTMNGTPGQLQINNVQVIIGEEYTVTYNDIEYVLEASVDGDGLIYLGDYNVILNPNSSTEVPFIIANITPNGLAYTASRTTPFTIEIKGPGKTIVKVPSEYLPGGLKEGTGALSIGMNNVKSEDVSGEGAHAVNVGKASGNFAHAENMGDASGYHSHAENMAQASGFFTHAEGESTIASGDGQHVQGRFNVSDPSSTYAHIVGNGLFEQKRSNAHTLDWSGNAWYQGDVYVGGTSQDVDSKKLATEEYVNNTITSNKPDWNASEGEAGYIEGRTHWVETNVEILPQMTLQGTEGSFSYENGFVHPLEKGKSYCVVWNGTEYNCVAKEMQANDIKAMLLGNCEILGLEATNEPFCIVEQAGNAEFLSYEGLTTTEVKITANDPIYSPLDIKFLPDYIYGYEKNIVEIYPNTTVSFESSGGLLANPFTYSLIPGETYEVLWNETAFSCIAHYKEIVTEDTVAKFTALGDTGPLYGTEPTGEFPFFILEIAPELVASGEPYGTIASFDDSLTEVTFNITGPVYKKRKIPDEFLPTKTHWVNEEEFEILPTTAISLDIINGQGKLPGDKWYEMTAGTTYKVVFNETEYLCEASAPDAANGMVQLFLGNAGALGGQTTNDPFGIGVVAPEFAAQAGVKAMLILTNPGAESCTIAVSEPVGTVHKIDKKFLPDDYTTEDELDQAIKSISYPVVSVNGKKGVVSLSASDVGALPNTTVIPSIEGLATETYVNEQVAALVDSSPDTLNTLNELAAALGDDPNFATTTATEIGKKVDKTTTVNGKALSNNITLSASDVRALPDTTEIPSIEGLATEFNVASGVYTSFKTSGTGTAYTATIDNVTELKEGMLFVMIPHITNTATQCTLNLNNLGAKDLLSNRLMDGEVMASVTLLANRPYVIAYSANSWIVANSPYVSIDISKQVTGTLPISSGGTGATDAATARTNLGIDLSDYYTKNQTNNQIASGVIDGTADLRNEIYTINTNLSTNYYTKTQTSSHITTEVSRQFSTFPIQKGQNGTSIRLIGTYPEDETYTLGSGAVAFGSNTKASGQDSLALGLSSVASNLGSVAEGYYTIASGLNSHTEGDHTIAASQMQHVEGRYNIEDATNKYAHIIGNGDLVEETRSNAHTVDWNGLGWYAGGLKIGGTGQDDANAVSVLTTNDLVAITNDEIDSICGAAIVTASEVAL